MSDERKSWLDEKRNVDGLFYGLCALSAALILAGFLDPGDHAHFAWDRWFGFFALFGFASYSVIVFAGKAWRRVVMRREDYYDR